MGPVKSDFRMVAMGVCTALGVGLLLRLPLRCGAEDVGSVQRLPPVADPSENVDWDREAAAMVERHLADSTPGYNFAALQPQQSSQMSQQARTNQRYSWNRARIGSPSQSG